MKTKLLILCSIAVALSGCGVSATPIQDIALLAFINVVRDENRPNRITGIYAENVFALQVIPTNEFDHISDMPSTVTQYMPPYVSSGNIIMTARGDSGILFFGLEAGDVIQVIYGDGSTRQYEVGRIEEYQIVSSDIHSDLVNLDTKVKISYDELLEIMFIGSNQLMLQAWMLDENARVLFVIAVPVEK